MKTDFSGNVIKKIEVVNHHGDLWHHDDRIYVAVNLGKFNDPEGNADSWVYGYDDGFNFEKKHGIKSGHTLLGIQTAAFAHRKWWFGCYGDPKISLVTDADFKMLGRYCVSTWPH